MTELRDIIALVETLSQEEQKTLLRHLGALVPPHPMEKRLNASAHTVLEAIARASALTIRGIEGIIAEASFAMELLPNMNGWAEAPNQPNAAYDFLLTDGTAEPVRLQVKMQRRRNHLPWMANEVMKKERKWPPNFYVVEVQRTRGGESPTGEVTRPYRFGEFDVLAVSLGAAKGHWRDFIYTTTNWLLPDPQNNALILKYQPVAPDTNDDWTTNFEEAVARFRSGRIKTIAG